MNKLFYGDNLTIMRKTPAESVDLIYLDPPFNSNRSYNLLYKNTTGLPIPEQIEAFCDTWEMDCEKTELAERIPKLMRDYGIRNDAVQFWHYLTLSLKESNPRLLAYLIYMTVRLIEMPRILKPSGSIYLHCDPTSSHYLKIVLDNIFGFKNFVNEIIWYYKNASRGKKKLAKSHDVILWYSKTDTYQFNVEALLVPFESGMTEWRYKRGGQKDKPMPAGKIPDDVITLPSLNTMSKERLGYPTQKPLALLERIIQASSKEEDTVFDPFCGCGT
ncbi:MAG: site-specific DNA-methyltransferase, partial [Spirochaetaceae bacterium]|nr:site-specific DNA-methyltransferase [Spirochaetaceae bacterium]